MGPKWLALIRSARFLGPRSNLIGRPRLWVGAKVGPNTYSYLIGWQFTPGVSRAKLSFLWAHGPTTKSLNMANAKQVRTIDWSLGPSYGHINQAQRDKVKAMSKEQLAEHKAKVKEQYNKPVPGIVLWPNFHLVRSKIVFLVRSKLACDLNLCFFSPI